MAVRLRVPSSPPPQSSSSLSVSPSLAESQAKTIALLANLSAAVQSARANLTLASWRLRSAQDEKQQRDEAVLRNSIDTFRLKAALAALKDKDEAEAMEAADLKLRQSKAAAKVTAAQRAQELAAATVMDATENLMDAKMTASHSSNYNSYNNNNDQQQPQQRRTVVGIDMGADPAGFLLAADDNASGGRMGGGAGGGLQGLGYGAAGVAGGGVAWPLV